MEIKEGSEIYSEIDKLRAHELSKAMDLGDKKWVSVESLEEYIASNSYGYRDNGCNILNADELANLLAQHDVK